MVWHRLHRTWGGRIRKFGPFISVHQNTGTLHRNSATAGNVWFQLAIHTSGSARQTVAVDILENKLPNTMTALAPRYQFLESPDPLDIGSLAKRTLEPFSLIEPWYHVDRGWVHISISLPTLTCVAFSSIRSEHVPIVGVAEQITCQADIYRKVIENSVESASIGIAFAEDVIALCDFITNGQHSEKDLNGFLSSMLKYANNGHTLTLDTSNEFRGVRIALLQVRGQRYLLVHNAYMFRMPLFCNRFAVNFPKNYSMSRLSNNILSFCLNLCQTAFLMGIATLQELL